MPPPSTPTLLAALTDTPRVSAPAWRRIGWLRRYLIVSRAALLPLTLQACLLGGLLALPWTPAEGGRLLLASVGLVFAHAAANLLNDLLDWLFRGRDGRSLRLRFGAHPLAQGLVHPLTHTLLLLISALPAVLLGLMVSRMAGTPVYVLSGIGAVLLMLWPLQRLGLGELVAFALWGPLVVGGVYWVVSGDWGPEIALLSAVAGLGPAAVVLARHTDRLRDDAGRGGQTLAVALGPTWAPRLLAVVAAAQVGAAVAWAWATASWAYLLVLAALPALLALLWRCLRPRPTARPPDFPSHRWPLWYTAAGFRFAQISGSALVAAAFLDGVW